MHGAAYALFNTPCARLTWRLGRALQSLLSFALRHGHVILDCTAGRLPDGRVVCAGTIYLTSSAEESSEEDENPFCTKVQVTEPLPQGSPDDASWRWRVLPGTSVVHLYGCGCMLSDGRFAIFGGTDASAVMTSSCEVLTLDAHGARWSPLPPMHEPRREFACVAIDECVIVAGGVGSTTSELYEEGLGRWRQLPCSLAHRGQLSWMGWAAH